MEKARKSNTIPCPNCKSRIEVNSTKRPLRVKCDNCYKEYTLGVPKGKKDKLESIPKKAKPQTQNKKPEKPKTNDEWVDTSASTQETKKEDSGAPTVVCPNCERTIDLPAKSIKKIHCACGRRIRLDGQGNILKR